MRRRPPVALAPPAVTRGPPPNDPRPGGPDLASPTLPRPTPPRLLDGLNPEEIRTTPHHGSLAGAFLAAVLVVGI